MELQYDDYPSPINEWQRRSSHFAPSWDGYDSSGDEYMDGELWYELCFGRDRIVGYCKGIEVLAIPGAKSEFNEWLKLVVPVRVGAAARLRPPHTVLHFLLADPQIAECLDEDCSVDILDASDIAESNSQIDWDAVYARDPLFSSPAVTESGRTIPSGLPQPPVLLTNPDGAIASPTGTSKAAIR